MPSIACGPEDGKDDVAAELLVQLGATLRVDIGLDDSSRLDDEDAKPSLVLKDFQAVIDTGATENCIDSGLAVTLGLPIVDQATIAGVLNPPTDVNVHMAQVYIHGLDHTFVDRFAAVDLAAGGQPHHLLLGRSFLKRFKLIYDGPNGTVTIGQPEDFPPEDPGEPEQPAPSQPET